MYYLHVVMLGLFVIGNNHFELYAEIILLATTKRAFLMYSYGYNFLEVKDAIAMCSRDQEMF